MKKEKVIKGLVIIMLASYAPFAHAQLSKEQLKERKEMRKLSKAELNEKASKDARKLAKQYKKEKWMVAPGALPIEKQLDRVYQMKYEIDEDLFPKYVMGEAISIGENYDAAKMQALALAKQNLAGEIQTEVTQLIENNVDNQQLAPEEAASVVKTISAGKQVISQSIGRTITVIEMYRTVKNRNKEVRVMIAYSAKMAKEAAKNAVRKNLEAQGEELGEKLNEKMGW